MSPRRSPLHGYNHNLRYGGRVFHVQTEDSGLDNPQVLTHLFLEGQIISTLRSSYADLLGEAQADLQLRQLMQRQHKEILKRLRRGELDHPISAIGDGETAQPLAPGPPDESRAATPTRPVASDAPLTGPRVAPPAQKRSLPQRAPAPTPTPAALPATAASTPADFFFGSATQPPGRRSPIPPPPGRKEEGVIHIPLDHPAFSGIPMLEFDESAEDESLELDLEAINELDLDAPTQVIDLDAVGPDTADTTDTADKPLPAAYETSSSQPRSRNRSRAAFESTTRGHETSLELDLDAITQRPLVADEVKVVSLAESPQEIQAHHEPGRVTRRSAPLAPVDAAHLAPTHTSQTAPTNDLDLPAAPALADPDAPANRVRKTRPSLPVPLVHEQVDESLFLPPAAETHAVWAGDIDRTSPELAPRRRPTTLQFPPAMESPPDPRPDESTPRGTAPERDES